MIPDKGKWKSCADPNGEIFVESDDFTHDVRLYLNGDFASQEDGMKYAEHIARRLDATRPSPSINKHGNSA